MVEITKEFIENAEDLRWVFEQRFIGAGAKKKVGEVHSSPQVPENWEKKYTSASGLDFLRSREAGTAGYSQRQVPTTEINKVYLPRL